MHKVPKTTAYTLDDTCFRHFNILYTERGWWKDIDRVYLLIEGIKTKKTLKEAWEHAGISEKQWRNLTERHPNFDSLRRRCQSRARKKDFGSKWECAQNEELVVIHRRDFTPEMIAELERNPPPPPRMGPKKKLSPVEAFQVEDKGNHTLNDIAVFTAQCTCGLSTYVALIGKGLDFGRGPEIFSLKERRRADYAGATIVLDDDPATGRQTLMNACRYCKESITTDYLLPYFHKASDQERIEYLTK